MVRHCRRLNPMMYHHELAVLWQAGFSLVCDRRSTFFIAWLDEKLVLVTVVIVTRQEVGYCYCCNVLTARVNGLRVKNKI